MAPGPAALEALESDAVDAVMGVFDDAPAGVRRLTLYEETFVTLMRAGHPALGSELTLERFLALDHLVVSVTGVGPAPVDALLSATGRARRVKVRVPNFFSAVEIAARSDLVMTLPAPRPRGGGHGALRRPAAAGRSGQARLSLLWHARQQDAPRHVWLRRVIVAAAAEMRAAARSAAPVAALPGGGAATAG